MPIVVDAHQHFWDLSVLEYPWIPREHRVFGRNYLPQDLAPLLSREGVNKTVLVQANHSNEENRWALKLAAKNPFIAGVVGVADLVDTRMLETLNEFADNPCFVGVRFNIAADSTADGVVKPELARGLSTLDRLGLTCDLLVPPGLLIHVPAIAAAFPNVRFIVDHLGCPSIRTGEMEPWSQHLETVSEFPNVVVKLSGMITQADVQNWRPNDLKPYVHAAIELFGFDRLMFGSDWPVCLLAGGYDRVVAALRECVGAVTDAERDMIWGGTAIKAYGLKI